MSIIQNMEKPTPIFPKDLIKLTYSKHAKERLIERTTGALILAPKLIRLTSSNTKDVIVKNGKVVHATVFIHYKRKTWMFLPIYVPSGLVKTVYFDAKENTSKKRNISVKKISPQEELRTFKKANEVIKEINQIEGGDFTEFSGIREDVGNVSSDMGGKKTSRWEKLLRIIRRIFGKRTKNIIL